MTGRGHYVELLLPYYLVVAGMLMDKRNGWFGIAALGVSFSLSGIPREIVPLTGALGIWQASHLNIEHFHRLWRNNIIFIIECSKDMGLLMGLFGPVVWEHLCHCGVIERSLR
jgi:hypothetical protein